VQAVGLKTHIWNNNLRSTFLLAGFPVLLILLVYTLQLAAMWTGFLPSTDTYAGDFALSARWMAASAPLALIVAGIWFLIAYFANTGLIALATGAHKVERAEQPELYNLLENLTIARGLAMPKLLIIDTPALNAFASGVNQKQYTVTVTTGLLEALDKDELEAVLAHELTHIINKDVRTMIIAAVFAGIITLLAEMLFRSIRHSMFMGGSRGGGGKGKGGALILFLIAAMVILMIGRLLAVVIRMSLSRTREFVADAGAAELTKNPDAMIRALRKISGSEPLKAPPEVRGMFVDNPGAQGAGVMGIFATHPPIEKRIAALVDFAGGLDLPISPSPGPETAAGPAYEPGPWG
jgi:heat shock protein HtpX